MNQYIYVVGGFIEHSKFAIERFDIQKNSWEEIGYLENNRAKFQAVYLAQKEKIIIMGGKKDGERIAKCEEFSIKKKKWRKSKMKLTNPKSGFGALVCKSIIFYAI